jgi:long-subunit fatty acid transport protein
VKGRIILLTLLVYLITRPVYGQNNDFGIWYGINIEHPVNKKLEVDVSAMLRTFNNCSKTEQAFLEGGISYKLNKYLSLGGAYRLTENLEDNNEFHIRHKWFADAKGTLPLEKFSFSARFRFQIQKKTYFKNDADKIPDYHSRIKLKGLYKSPKFPLNPYVCVEMFSPLFKNSDRLIDKNRFSAGFEYKISKKHSLEVEYIFQRDFLPHISDINILSISYNFKF